MKDTLPVENRGHFRGLTQLTAKVIGLLPKPFLRVIYSLCRNTPGYIGLGLRYVCLKHLAKTCGDNVAIFPNVLIKHPENLILGNNVSVHPYCYIDAIGKIEIGDNVSIANHSSLISFGHTWEQSDVAIKYNPLIMTPIHISDDVWIGCGVRIIGPCKIGSRVIIAAGAVARGTMDGGYIYGGVPAHIIKNISKISSML